MKDEMLSVEIVSLHSIFKVMKIRQEIKEKEGKAADKK